MDIIAEENGAPLLTSEWLYDYDSVRLTDDPGSARMTRAWPGRENGGVPPRRDSHRMTPHVCGAVY